MTALKNNKYLKIEKGKGFYWNGKEYKEIDRINKEDLLKLLDTAEAKTFKMEPYDESKLQNKAHQIIYQNIHSKFKQFLENKEQFKTEVDNLFKEAIRKYSDNNLIDKE